jgi:hypothetical protein
MIYRHLRATAITALWNIQRLKVVAEANVVSEFVR